jgi:hypothetical protein
MKIEEFAMMEGSESEDDKTFSENGIIIERKEDRTK